MKAPDKITISKYNIADDGDVVFAWVDNSPECEPMNHPVEYIRADAFIKKACSGIEKLLSGYIIRNFHFRDSYDIDRLIEDFKNYMKGE